MLNIFLNALLSVFKTHQTLVLENAALRHQVEVLSRNSTRAVIRWRGRVFLDILCMIWPDWWKAILIVQPDTVIKWHKMASDSIGGGSAGIAGQVDRRLPRRPET
jgi:hypothetical protein